MQFEVFTQSVSGIQTPFEAQAKDFPSIPCAIPTEFKGPGNAYSPEDLFVLSVATCFVATFKVFAERTQFSFKTIEVKAILYVEKNEKGILGLHRMHFDCILKGSQDKEKAQKLLVQAEKSCLVSNVIQSQKTYNYSILSE